MKSEITFRLTLPTKTVEVKTYPNEYRSLMALLYDKFYLDDFGECKGIGRCGTCLVVLENAPSPLLNRERNELTTLNKMEYVGSTGRLSCQILVDDKINNVHFTVYNIDDPGLY